MTLKEIDDTIRALENSSCTFGNCQKLASLYICREYFQTCSKTLHNREKTDKFKDFIVI